jgi:hypothetical protein
MDFRPGTPDRQQPSSILYHKEQENEQFGLFAEISTIRDNTTDRRLTENIQDIVDNLYTVIIHIPDANNFDENDWNWYRQCPNLRDTVFNLLPLNKSMFIEYTEDTESDPSYNEDLDVLVNENNYFETLTISRPKWVNLNVYAIGPINAVANIDDVLNRQLAIKMYDIKLTNCDNLTMVQSLINTIHVRHGLRLPRHYQNIIGTYKITGKYGEFDIEIYNVPYNVMLPIMGVLDGGQVDFVL